MSGMNKRLWRMFRESKGKYIGILLLLFFGSFLFVAATGAAGNMDAMLARFEVDHKQEDVFFTTSQPLADIPALEAASGAVIEGYLSYDLVLGEDVRLRVLSPNEKVNLPALREGEWPSEPGDILLDPYFMANQGLSIGDRLTAEGKTLRVTGIVARPHYTYALQNVYDLLPPPGFGVAMMAESDFEGFPQAETIYAARFDQRDGMNAQLVGLRRILKEDGHAITEWVDAMNNKRIRMPWASVNGVKSMSVPLPTAIYLLGCLIVGIIVWRMIKADSVIIGALYAQGLRRRELTRHYMALPLILALMAGLLGTGLAIPCVEPVVSVMLTSYYNVPTIGFSLSPVNVLLGILLPALFVGFASFFVIRGELTKTAAELMKGDRDSAKVNRLERRLRLERFRFNTKFQIRAQLRSIPRLLFLLLGVTGASVIMLFGFTIQYSMNTAFSDLDGTEMYNFNWEYSFKEQQTGELPEGAQPFNAMRAYPEGRESVEFYITGVPSGSDTIILTDKNGSPLPQDQANITSPLAERMKLNIGDSITFVDKLDGGVYSLTVGGIADTYVGQFIFMPLADFNAMAGLPAHAYSGVFSDTPLDYDEKMLSGVKDLKAVSGAGDELMAPMMSMVVLITMFAAIMGVIIIYLVTSLMIEESRGTVSLMKVFGYRKKELGKLLLNSSNFAVIIGFLLAVPLTISSADLLYSYLGEMINLALPILISPLYVLISLVLIMAAYQLTKLMCGRKLNRIPMQEALKAAE